VFELVSERMLVSSSQWGHCSALCRISPLKSSGTENKSLSSMKASGLWEYHWLDVTLRKALAPAGTRNKERGAGMGQSLWCNIVLNKKWRLYFSYRGFVKFRRSVVILIPVLKGLGEKGGDFTSEEKKSVNNSRDP